MVAIIDINRSMILEFKNQLRATEAQHWQKFKNSQPQLKIYWFLKKSVLTVL